jgi:putative phosphoserine phosphatase/1-acylglycerol-3-phosphate O-acyltransferase
MSNPVLDERLAAIAAAPDGPQVGAFFDYDGTVISGYSAQAFYRHRILGLDIGPVEIARTLLMSVQGIESSEDFAEFLGLSLSAWKGKTQAELDELGAKLFKHDIASRLHPEAWALVQAHRAKGHTIALASSATRFQVVPMAKELGIDHVLCTPVEIIDGVVTGRPGGPPLWSAGKADAVRALAAVEDLDLGASFAYSNGAEDIPFLETVGSPVAVAPHKVLRAEATRREWPIVDCAPRGGTPGLRSVARTVGFYSAFAAAFGAGVGLSILNRDRDQLLEITGGVGADLGLALAGIDVKIVRGHEHLWSTRPAVFVFNHQSKLDPILVMKLLRGGFTGVAKKEAKNVPGFGQLFQLAGVAFVERGNIDQAKQAIQPAIDKVREEGLSLAIAPEGTRSATPRLGRFKKGAFHIAMQAEVPMIPIVIRNAGEVMWRGAQVMNPGTVEVAVLPPVDTRRWTPRTIGDHVHEVRGMFLETLADWPTGPRLELHR